MDKETFKKNFDAQEKHYELLAQAGINVDELVDKEIILEEIEHYKTLSKTLNIHGDYGILGVVEDDYDRYSEIARKLAQL